MPRIIHAPFRHSSHARGQVLRQAHSLDLLSCRQDGRGSLLGGDPSESQSQSPAAASASGGQTPEAFTRSTSGSCLALSERISSSATPGSANVSPHALKGEPAATTSRADSSMMHTDLRGTRRRLPPCRPT